MARLSLVGGYLGAGKTTLIHSLLRRKQLTRVALVVNDFGSVNIDSQLIAETSDDVIELSNGCMCCQLGESVDRVMSQLAYRDDIDHVICEMSGVGEPRHLANWRLYPGFSAGPIVVCVDAAKCRELLANSYVGDLVRRQIGCADVVVVTGSESATTGQVEHTLQACRELASEAEITQQSADEITPDVCEALVGNWSPRRRGLVKTSSETAKTGQSHRSISISGFSANNFNDALDVLRQLTATVTRAKGVIGDEFGRFHDVQIANGRLCHQLLERESRREALGSEVPNREALSLDHFRSETSRIVFIVSEPHAADRLQAAVSAFRKVLRPLG